MDEATVCRPLFPFEMEDPDFSWLINKFLESRPEFRVVESPCLPVILIQGGLPAAPASTGEKALPAPVLLDELGETDEEHPEG